MATPSDIARQGGCLYCTDDSCDGVSASCTSNQPNWASAAKSTSGHAQNDAPFASNSQNQQPATQSSHAHDSDGSISDSYSMVEVPAAQSDDKDDSDSASDSYCLVEESAAPATNGTLAITNATSSASSPAAPTPSVAALIKENEDLKIQIKWLWQEDRHTRDKYEEHHDFLPEKKMRKLETRNKKLEVVIEELEYDQQGLKDEIEGLQNEKQALWDKKDEIEEDIAYLRSSRREKDAEMKAKIEKLEREKEQIVQEGQAKIKALEDSYQTTIRDLQDENAKLHQQRNQDIRYHVADSDIARDNIAYTIKLEEACVELRDKNKGLKQQLQKEELDNFKTRQVALSRLEELQEQRVSHRKETADLHKKLDTYETKQSNAITELMEQDETIRTLRHKLDRHHKEAAEYSTASRRVFKDQERNAQKLRDKNEDLRQQLQGVQKAQRESDNSTRTFLELCQFVQTPPPDSDTEGSTDEQDSGRNLGSWTKLRACNGKSRRGSIYPSQVDGKEEV